LLLRLVQASRRGRGAGGRTPYINVRANNSNELEIPPTITSIR
jgi:hypothetical protein